MWEEIFRSLDPGVHNVIRFFRGTITHTHTHTLDGKLTCVGDDFVFSLGRSFYFFSLPFFNLLPLCVLELVTLNCWKDARYNTCACVCVHASVVNGCVIIA